MSTATELKLLLRQISKVSPLFDYWNSQQDFNDEEKRLLIANNEINWDAGVQLFKNEPYKWEILFQSIILEVIQNEKRLQSGEKSLALKLEDSLRILKKLILMININEREKLIDRLAQYSIFTLGTIGDLKYFSFDNCNDITLKGAKKQLDFGRFLRVLSAIFTNPYCIRIKRKPMILYEYTGILFYSLRVRLQNK